MLRQLRTCGGGMASSAAAAAAAQVMGELQSSLAAAAACGNLRLLRHLSADGSPSSSSPSGGGSSSSTSIAEDPRWKSPLFDALLSLAARASIMSTSTSSTSTSTPSKTSTPSPPPPLRSVVAERHGLFDSLLDVARTAQAHMLSKFIRSNVELSFDEREFLEGAADARHAVFDALSGDGDLSPLRGAVAPGLLRALHGLKEMHSAAGLAVRMTATEDDDGSGSSSAPSSTLKAELGVMGLLDPPLFDAMSSAVPGFEALSAVSREHEARLAAGGESSSTSSSSSSSSSREGSSESSSSSGAGATTARPRSGLELAAFDMDSFKEAVAAAKTKGGAGGVFGGKYQVLAVRFTGAVLVQTFAKSTSSSLATEKEKEKEEGEEEASVVVAAAASSSSSSSSSSPPPPAAPTPQPKPSKSSTSTTTTLTLVRELLDKRPHSWRFARGPLPEGGGGLPVRQLGLPWTLLSIDLD